MSITEIIRNRRATPPRFLSGNNIPEEKILKLLESANWAPNHKKTEPWRFKIFRGSAKVKLADKVYQTLTSKIEEGIPINPEKVEKFRKNLLHVPVVIAIIMQRDKAERIAEWEEIAAIAMAVQNIWLTATEMGLGVFWATPGFMHYLEDILETEHSQKSLGFIYIGEIAMDFPSPGRGDVSEKVIWM